MSCEHTELKVVATPYVLADEENGEIVARTVHLTVSCATCGTPLCFEGRYDPAPADKLGLQAVVGPWSSPFHEQIAMKVRPFTGDDYWAFAPSAGNA